MKQYNRSNITEEPIIDADQSWKLRYLEQLKESRETGKPLSEVINADRELTDALETLSRSSTVVVNQGSYRVI